jgi:hypothetical protein
VYWHVDFISSHVSPRTPLRLQLEECGVACILIRLDVCHRLHEVKAPGKGDGSHEWSVLAAVL